MALVRQVGTEESVLGLHDRARASGPAASPPGTSSASTSPPARAENPGRVLRLDRRRAAAAVRAVVPVRPALHRRPGQHGAPDRVHRPAARGARGARHPVGGPRARAEQPGIRRDPGGRRAAGAPPSSCCRRSPGSRPAASPPSSSPPSTACAAGSAAPSRPHRAGPRRPRGRAVRLARATTTSTATGSSPRCSPAAGADVAWCERARRGRAAATRSPRPWSGSRRRCRPRALRRRRSRRPPAASPPWWRRCGRTPRWTAPRCRPPTSSRASTARW